MSRKSHCKLQAVVFTDTFDDEFYPLTQDIPSTLIPLLNKPILSYTLEALQIGGIDEIFLFCKSGVQAIKEFVREAKEDEALWTYLTIHIITSESCQTLGDCFRDLDARGLIRDDFILVGPGVITNVDFRPIFDKHKEITKKDKGACITMMCMKTSKVQAIKCEVDNSLYIITPEGKLVFYKNCEDSEDHRTKVPLDLILAHDQLVWHRCVRDIGLAICSPKFLPLFSDNFDFQTKEDFIKNLLMNEEILDCTMYVHLLRGVNFGAAAINLQNYHAMSFEVYDMRLGGGFRENRLINTDKYIHRGIAGRSTSVPKCAKISKCVLGENVKIGKNVYLEECVVLSNCVIGDNVKIQLSVVGPDCILMNNCQINNNSVLGKNVQINENVIVDKCLVQATKPEFCDEKDILGEHAYIAHLERSNKIPELSTRETVMEKVRKVEEYIETDAEDDESSRQSPEIDDTEVFLNEVIESLARGIEDDVNCENLIFEINGSRYAYQIPLHEVNFFVVKAILKMYSQKNTGLKYLATLLTKFRPILKNYIRNEESMKDCLSAVEDQAVGSGEEDKDWVLYVLKWFYQNDILSEDVILNWGKSLDTSEKLYIKIYPFMKWLEEADEESSDE
ncbi:translation initiation factor eIF-2B subunit epsilon [Harmonia axyridis]|uniref:translation initiation factor eIF-2B subunit epsilon n=1 Tax=Harmonia axyridis TaxID=115357 RepID=UPI001E275116|nr:translation initiation factor eIF-2B subunit epsilon [Harmonia axyridis]